MQMMHPGLREAIEPLYYAINAEKLIACVRFNDRTVDTAFERIISDWLKAKY